MYAELHPVYTKIFVKSRTPTQQSGPVIPSERGMKLMSKAQYYPNNDFLNHLRIEYQFASGNADLFFEVWMPVYNADSGSYKLEKTKEY